MENILGVQRNFLEQIFFWEIFLGVNDLYKRKKRLSRINNNTTMAELKQYGREHGTLLIMRAVEPIDLINGHITKP